MDDICHPPVKSRPKSHSSVICMSSACHPHVICTRFQPQKYFQLNSRARALLKRDKIDIKPLFPVPLNSTLLIELHTVYYHRKDTV